MKRIVKCMMVALCMAVAVAFAAGVATNVSAKSKVTYKLKKGTLTIKGKGDMPKKIKVKKSKVKKIVIKKGVKSISNNAFSGFTKAKKVSIAKSVKKIGINAFKKTAVKTLTIPTSCTKLGSGFIDSCKKLDTLTVPGNFTIINKSGKAQQYRKSTSGTNLETVIFNTNLDYNVAAYFRTYDFQTAATDPKFKTFDGVIYTKDGTGIVRVPSARDTITLKNGCTDFNTYAVTYVSGGKNDFTCFDLKRVTIPQTVVRVNNEAYADDQSTNRDRSLDIAFDNTKLEMPEIVRLKNRFVISAESLMKKLPTRIAKVDDVYVGDSKYLIQGSDINTTNLPDGVTTICEEAFKGLGVQDVILPASVTKIDNYAFENTYLNNINLDYVKSIGKAAFRGTRFTKIELPATITAVSDQLFYDCQELTEVTFKGELKSVGAKAFYNTRVNINDFLKNNAKLDTIGKSAFENVGWTNITIPANIKTVGDYAFYETNNTKFALVKGNTSGFSQKAFGAKTGVTFQFEQGVAQAWTYPDHDYYSTKKNSKLSVWWDKVSEVNGYDIWVAKDAKLTKGVKKYTAKYNEKSKNITIKAKKAKGLKYFGIRPYKNVNGKKVYGKWSIKAL